MQSDAISGGVHELHLSAQVGLFHIFKVLYDSASEEAQQHTTAGGQAVADIFESMYVYLSRLGLIFDQKLVYVCMYVCMYVLSFGISNAVHSTLQPQQQAIHSFAHSPHRIKAPAFQLISCIQFKFHNDCLWLWLWIPWLLLGRFQVRFDNMLEIMDCSPPVLEDCLQALLEGESDDASDDEDESSSFDDKLRRASDRQFAKCAALSGDGSVDQ